MKSARFLVCPKLFHSPKNRPPKPSSRKPGKDSIEFGKVLEDYVLKQLQKRGIPATQNGVVNYLGIRGVYDIATHDTVIEVKYSTEHDPKELAEAYAPQAAFYAVALGKPKAMVVAANPTLDKKHIKRMKQEEVQKWAEYIFEVVKGRNDPRPGPHCTFCPLKFECEAYDLYKRAKENTSTNN